MAVVHSFDVFDTSLVRKVAAPTDVFRLMGILFARKVGITHQADFAEEFLSARLQAQQKAKTHCEETTLEEIWTILRRILPQLPSGFGSKDELEVEGTLLLPNSIVAQQISTLRSAGARIVFTSDTYLPEKFVHEQLLRHGIAEERDTVYTSSTFRVTKSSGGLFKIVLSREGIVGRDLHHYGDDSYSDVTVPRGLGIGTTLLNGSRLNIWERGVLSQEVQHRMATSLLAGSMRAFRLSAATSDADQLVATFLGPALMVWAAWILSTAQRDGVQRLYFISRDTYLLCRAARVLVSNFGKIDCRYLKISRQSIFLPSTGEISPSGMPWLDRPWELPQLDWLVQKLGLSWSDVAWHFSSLAGKLGKSKVLTEDSDWSAFWNIIQNEPVAGLVRAQINIKKDTALAYLDGTGLFDQVPAALVDIGWFAMSQARLRKLLDRSGHPSTLVGYYLAARLDRVPPGDAGKVTALFHDRPDDYSSISHRYAIFERSDVLEHVLGLAPHGSIREYEANGSVVEPVCHSESALHVELVTKIGNAIEAFCEQNREIVPYYTDAATAREIMNALIDNWCSHPDETALKALEHVIVSDGPNEIASQRLLQPWRSSDAMKTLVPRRWQTRLKITVPSQVWPEVALYRSGSLVKFVLRLSAMLRLFRKKAQSMSPPFEFNAKE